VALRPVSRPGPFRAGRASSTIGSGTFRCRVPRAGRAGNETKGIAVRVYEAIAKGLESAGVEAAFGGAGENAAGLMIILEESKRIRPIIARNERAASSWRAATRCSRTNLVSASPLRVPAHSAIPCLSACSPTAGTPARGRPSGRPGWCWRSATRSTSAPPSTTARTSSPGRRSSGSTSTRNTCPARTTTRPTTSSSPTPGGGAPPSQTSSIGRSAPFRAERCWDATGRPGGSCGHRSSSSPGISRRSSAGCCRATPSYWPTPARTWPGSATTSSSRRSRTSARPVRSGPWPATRTGPSG
jgi:hypothetical protein